MKRHLCVPSCLFAIAAIILWWSRSVSLAVTHIVPISIGGTSVDTNQFRFVAAILRDDEANFYAAYNPLHAFQCTASYIGENYFITAAHCVATRPMDVDGEFETYPDIECLPQDEEFDICLQDSEYLKILVDARRLVAEKGELLGVKNIVVHEEYAGEFWHGKEECSRYPLFTNDIAIIETIKAPTQKMDRVLLADSEFMTSLAGEPLYMASALGWGQTLTGHSTAILTRLDAPLVARDICNERFRLHSAWRQEWPQSCIPEEVIDENVVCSGWLNGPTRTTCFGDSGGPLVVENEVGQWVQIGVTSIGDGIDCGSPFLPTAFTSIAAHLDWIRSHVSDALPLSSPGIAKSQ